MGKPWEVTGHGGVLGYSDGTVATCDAGSQGTVAGRAAAAGDPPGRGGGAIASGGVVPTSERVAAELAIEPADVRAAYACLLADGLLEERVDGVLCIASQGRETTVGDATQIRFETALLKAVREAAARGLSSAEATGMFKAALIRLEAMERPKKPRE